MSPTAIMCVIVGGPILFGSAALTLGALAERHTVPARDTREALLFAWVLFHIGHALAVGGPIDAELGTALHPKAGQGPDGLYYLHRTGGEPLEVSQRTYECVYFYQLFMAVCHVLTVVVIGPMLIYVWRARQGSSMKCIGAPNQTGRPVTQHLSAPGENESTSAWLSVAHLERMDRWGQNAAGLAAACLAAGLIIVCVVDDPQAAPWLGPLSVAVACTLIAALLAQLAYVFWIGPLVAYLAGPNWEEFVRSKSRMKRTASADSQLAWRAVTRDRRSLVRFLWSTLAMFSLLVSGSYWLMHSTIDPFSLFVCAAMGILLLGVFGSCSRSEELWRAIAVTGVGLILGWFFWSIAISAASTWGRGEFGRAVLSAVWAVGIVAALLAVAAERSISIATNEQHDDSVGAQGSSEPTR